MMRVTLLYSPAPRVVYEEELNVPDAATVLEAVQASGLPGRYPELDWRALPAGIWGKEAPWDRPLKDLDRIELCRPLTVDPKVARRERFAKQGARGTGLFAKRRQGAKAGY
ncbi:RnfH family protein [Variovorax sp. J22R133]|uniref:RnfH family protein n=1 Tax=Variovorax brevis TaxID=3053503 RepID=UPI00257614AB|nr:RnfH family protein [Variovorax sp. J22R133]MDM0111158.1 RnfH family protein [Variovorax sp. J22R133]